MIPLTEVANSPYDYRTSDVSNLVYSLFYNRGARMELLSKCNYGDVYWRPFLNETLTHSNRHAYAGCSSTAL